ncbi:hypothetical protein D3C86_1862990 [compost metagenome]
MPLDSTRARAIGAFTTITGKQVDLRQITALGGFHLLLNRQTCIDPRLDFRMHLKRALHGFVKGLAVGRQGDRQGKGNKGKKTHWRLDSFQG